MVATAQMLDKQGVIAYIGANASRFGVDPAALLAVANHEGLNTEPGKTWILPNEGGAFNFGPPSWQSHGAGAAIVQQQGASAAYWSWTPAGLDYWMQKAAESGAAGKTGLDAITWIVGGYGWGFERPANSAKEVSDAWGDYSKFQQQLQTPLPGNIIVPTPDNPGHLQVPLPGQQFPTPTDPQQTNPTTPGTVAPKFSLHLLDTPGGPINLTLPWDLSGILLFLAALLAIIIGALMWDKSRNVIVKGTETAAIAAA